MHLTPSLLLKGRLAAQQPHQRLEARQHRRLAASQRGAAVFVVVLVVTMLTGLGLFAVRSSTMATATSGYNRQLTQVDYITVYAVAATVSDISASEPQAVVDDPTSPR